jgi:guanylate kinase
MTTPQRLLFILSGPSGVGKATVARKAFERAPGIAKVVTYATRAIRPGEKNHETYHFVTPEEFQRKIDAGELFEWEKVYGDCWYGSPKDPFEHVPEGFDALLEIGVGGMKSYRAAFPEAITLFLSPPSMKAILERIENRGGQEPNLENRLQSAVRMIEEAGQYDYIIVNDDLDKAVEQLAGIILAERCKRQRKQVIQDLARQVEEWKKDQA